MNIRNLLLGLAAASFTTACSTTLGTQQVQEGNFKTTGSGSSYYLPQQAVRIAVTYRVQSCEKNAVQITRSAAVTTQNRVDDTARFVVPVSSLSSRFKTTSLTVGVYDDGILRSLGATVDDRSAEIINGVVGTASSVARLAAGTALSSSSQCSDETSENVKARDTLLKDLRDPMKYIDADERAAAIDRLSRLNASLQFVRNITFLPSRLEAEDLNNVSDDLNRVSKNLIDVSEDLKRVYEDPNRVREDLNRVSQNLNNVSNDLKNVSYKLHRVSQEFDSSSATKGVLERWLKGANDDYLAKLQAITVCVLPGGDGGGTIKGANADGCNDGSVLALSAENPPSKGLVYREPRRVRVQVCGDACSNDDVIGSGTVTLAQLGDWRSVELNSKAFQDKNVMAMWTQAGQLTSLTIGSSSSIEAIANTLNMSATTAREAIGEIVTTDIERLNAEVANVRAEADLLEQQARLLGLQMIPEIEDP